MSFADIARRAAKLAAENSPAILTSIGIVGTITTAVLAGKASFQAADIIRLKEADDEIRGEYLEDPREILKDRLRLVWKLYIPTVATGVAAVVCIVGANKVGARRAASIAAGWSITEKAFDEYKTKVVEKIGEKKHDAIKDEIAQDRVNQYPLDENLKIRGLDNGEICYDPFGGQYFMSTVADLHAAVNALNNAINHDGYASLADLYRLLDIDVPAFSETLGWNSDRLVDLRISATVIAETKPCLVIGFREDPQSEYGRFH